MKPQPISTAPVDGTNILLFIPKHGWRSGYYSFGQRMHLPDFNLLGDPPATHWLPLPEPPAPRQAYYILDAGETVEEGDEFFTSRSSKWTSVTTTMIGSVVMDYHQPHRRAIPNPES